MPVSVEVMRRSRSAVKLQTSIAEKLVAEAGEKVTSNESRSITAASIAVRRRLTRAHRAVRESRCWVRVP